MTSVTRFAVAHRRLVALAWIVLAILGALATPSATSRMTHSFATPGNPGFDTNEQIRHRFGVEGNEQPTLAVLHLPAALSMRTAAGRAAAHRAFAAANRAGHLDVVDYARTRNPKLISSDGLTTWALINMPNPDLPIGTGVMDRIGPTVRAAAPPGAAVGVTGFEQLQSVGSSSGPSALVETMIGGVGALIVLAVVYGSAIAIVPLLMAIPSILFTFLLVDGLTHLTDVSFLVQFIIAIIALGVTLYNSLFMVSRRRDYD
jgi:RND superfamily putative drug exporter